MSDTAVADAPTETNAPTEAKSGNKPTFKLKLGNISVAVFADEKSTREGEIFTSHNIALQKSWKKPDGSFGENTMYLDPKDVMKVIAGLQQAFLATHAEKNS